MSKLVGIVSKLPAYADKSTITHRHGAALIKNGIPILFGYNKIQGIKTIHAECDVIRQFLLSRGVKLKYREKCILWE